MAYKSYNLQLAFVCNLQLACVQPPIYKEDREDRPERRYRQKKKFCHLKLIFQDTCVGQLPAFTILAMFWMNNIENEFSG